MHPIPKGPPLVIMDHYQHIPVLLVVMLWVRTHLTHTGTATPKYGAAAGAGTGDAKGI